MILKSLVSGVATILTLCLGSIAAASEQDLGQVTIDHDIVPGATLFIPASARSGHKLPVIVTGLLGNCSLEATPAMAESAAQHFHIPVAQRGFAVLAVGKIDANAPSPFAVAGRGPLVGGALDPHKLPPEVTRLLLDGWRPWRDALNVLEAKVEDRRNPYNARLDLTRIGAWGVSCGGVNGFTLASNDRRIKSVLGWTSATNPLATEESSKAMLEKIAPRPLMWVVGGPKDVAHAPGLLDWANLPASIPGVIAIHKDRDHAGMSNVDMDWVANWFDFALNPEHSAHDNPFRNPASHCASGTQCDWTIKTKNLDQLK